MTQRRLRESITVTIDNRSINDWSSTLSEIKSRNVMKDQIYSICSIIIALNKNGSYTKKENLISVFILVIRTFYLNMPNITLIGAVINQ